MTRKEKITAFLITIGLVIMGGAIGLIFYYGNIAKPPENYWPVMIAMCTGGFMMAFGVIRLMFGEANK